MGHNPKKELTPTSQHYTCHRSIRLVMENIHNGHQVRDLEISAVYTYKIGLEKVLIKFFFF